ncbi:hypothetical protein FSP39_024269 [Pinctada imbricata]|uniref:DOMON domain-containing protein n=1 Tax=Pinctada imbricata TaxID=66713 RepID=A0AA88YGE3_PINIB|nr:hypothetical protein FSP39_024269 [Pinctada imbricata]
MGENHSQNPSREACGTGDPGDYMNFIKLWKEIPLVLRILLVLTLIHTSEEYPSGAPSTACADMLPQHDAKPQSSPAPYRIQVSSESLTFDDNLTVNVSAVNGTFKGFLVRAVEASLTGPDYVVGSFVPLSQDSKLTCNNQDEPITTSLPPSSSVTPATSPQCQKGRGCFKAGCSDGVCDAVVMWNRKGDFVFFDIISRNQVGQNRWKAIGFSKTGKMADTSVIMCLFGTQVTAEIGYNDHYNFEVVKEDSGCLTSISGRNEDGLETCSFRRRINSTTSPDKIFTLYEKYYLLLGTGKIEGGSLMVLAWIFCSSLGIVVARYCKDEWPNSKPWGIKMWFHIDVPSDIAYSAKHPILGITVMALTVINPVMAFLRVDANHPNRPIFNWAHRIVGTSAHIIAAVTVFFGLNLPKSNTPTTASYVMLGYAVTYVLIEIIFWLHSSCSTSAADDDETLQPLLASSLEISTGKRKVDKDGISNNTLLQHLQKTPKHPKENTADTHRMRRKRDKEHQLTS